MSIRQIRANAKKTIHDFFSVPVIYTPAAVGATPIETTARIHLAKPMDAGEWSSTGFATMIEQAEYLIFDSSVITPMYKDVVSPVDDPIEYQIERSLPPVDGYVKAEVTRK